MILFVERYTDFMINQNPHAKFVYFETEKEDIATEFCLDLRHKDNGLAIRHRANMSDKGIWKEEEYSDKSGLVKVDFSNVFTNSKIARVVVFPVVSFNIVLSSLTEKYQTLFENEYARLIAHNHIRDYKFNNEI